MTISELLTQPESKILEFKKDLSSLRPILKTIVAFANTSGGTLIIGITSEKKLVGIADIFKSEETLANAIADGIAPSFLPEIEIATIEDKNLLIVKVFHWKAPFYLKKEGIPNGVFIRLGSTSRPASPEIILELQRSVMNQSFDQQGLQDLSQTALDFNKIQTAFKSTNKKIDERKLCSLGILIPFKKGFMPSIGGVILFGKDEIRQQYFPDAKVKCARFRGTTREDIVDRYEIKGSILDAVDEVPKFIARNTRFSAKIQKLRRKDIAEYPELALREILINAFAHADYSILGSTIQIAIFDDRLEVQNPGMLPFGFTMNDLKAGISRVRNRIIARVFHELHLMEEWGSGYKRVIEVCRKNNYPEPEWIEYGTSMRVTFFSHREASLLKPGDSLEKALSDREKTILKLFDKTNTLPFREIFKHFSTLLSERMLRYELVQLKMKGYLVTLGKGPSTTWKKRGK
jgi:ATP-dependent DNA helicase RecG